MKNIYLQLMSLILMFSLLYSCSNEYEDKDKDKAILVDMIISSETGYYGTNLSDIWSEVFIFSESDDNQMRMFTNIIAEGFDFEYEKGYEYTFKAEKVWMANPPQDVSPIKYVFIGPLTKKKVITEGKEEVLELFVSSNAVKFSPRFPSEYNEDGKLKIYDALLVRETNTNLWATLKEIEGFTLENGYEYVLSVKKLTQAEPYLVKYILLEIKERQKIILTYK